MIFIVAFRVQPENDCPARFTQVLGSINRELCYIADFPADLASKCLYHEGREEDK
jgi:hypothetical protein